METYFFLVEDVVIDDRLLVWINIFVCVSWVGESCKFFFEPGLQVGHDLLENIGHHGLDLLVGLVHVHQGRCIEVATKDDKVRPRVLDVLHNLICLLLPDLVVAVLRDSVGDHHLHHHPRPRLHLGPAHPLPGQVLPVTEQVAEVALLAELGEVGLDELPPGDDGEARAAGGGGQQEAVKVAVLGHVVAAGHGALDGVVVRLGPELLQQDDVVLAPGEQLPDLSHPALLVTGAEGGGDAPSVEGHHPDPHHVLPVVIVSGKEEANKHGRGQRCQEPALCSASSPPGLAGEQRLCVPVHSGHGGGGSDHSYLIVIHVSPIMFS